MDPDLSRLLSPDLRIEKVAALPLTRPRLVGDLGLRAFFYLYKRAKKMIKEEGFDFLLITIPSFYTALLGRWLHQSTGICYGIDYIDPWVHNFPGSEKKFSRHWWSAKLAAWLEPVAVKEADLLTGVAPGYYEGVLERNPKKREKFITGAMPYGGEIEDMKALSATKRKPYLFTKGQKCILVYAGALLPKAVEPLERIAAVIAENRAAFDDIQIYFIGTGKTADDPEGYRVRALAKKFGLWQTVFFEHPQRVPYLDVLVHLQAADGVFVLGSTEPHYTPSKVYQGVLAGKPIFAILHQDSTAVEVIRSSGVGTVLPFNGPEGLYTISGGFLNAYRDYREQMKSFNPAVINQTVFEQYSAKASTAKLAALLQQVMEKGGASGAKG
ncbi:MAG TPA: hypothetical protein VGN63_03725 [Flavisolibacter sp.]|nr:hypothetical protein [Flavisolibacter sp.]